MTKKIKQLLVEKDMTQKELAEKLNTSQANLSKKYKLDDWRESDLEEIANICNCDFIGEFVDRKN